MPDYVRGTTGAGDNFEIPVVQIWVDPAYPDAHRDPALRAYVARRAEEGVAALIRYSAHDGFSLIAPALAGDGQWHEVARPAGVPVDPEHTIADRARVLRLHR